MENPFFTIHFPLSSSKHVPAYIRVMSAPHCDHHKSYTRDSNIRHMRRELLFVYWLESQITNTDDFLKPTSYDQFHLQCAWSNGFSGLPGELRTDHCMHGWFDGWCWHWCWWIAMRLRRGNLWGCAGTQEGDGDRSTSVVTVCRANSQQTFVGFAVVHCNSPSYAEA